jgi:hypothetical protein
LIQDIWVIHGGVVPPVRICNTTVVDEDIDATAQEIRSLSDFLANVRDVSQVADCAGDIGEESLKVGLCSIGEFFFIDVEDEDFIATLDNCRGYVSLSSFRFLTP